MWPTQPAEVFEHHARESGLRDAMAALIARAQDAGALRADLVVDDVPMVMSGLGAISGSACHGLPGSGQRFLALVLDGMRVRDAAPLPE